MLALVLAAAIDLEEACAKYRENYVLPPAAVAAAKECGAGCERELAEQFANGEGVERDYDAAAYFLCHAGDHMAPAELEGMFEHLQRMRSGEETADLEFCDHVTSGYGMSMCASIRYDELMPNLEARLEALRGRVRAAGRFDSARALGTAYAEAEANRIGEQSRGGTGYAAFSLEAQIAEKQRVVESFETWTRQRAPSASAGEAKAADAELNKSYRKAQQEVDELKDIVEWTADLRTHLRDAQRRWIAYRDAFAVWYAEEWRGKASREVLRREIVTRLTRERAAQLLQP